MHRTCFAYILILILLTACNTQTKEELLQKGEQLSQQENYSGALVYYKNALEKDPSYFEARYHLAVAYLRTGKFAQAEKEFEKVERQNPSFPELPLRLAELYLYMENPEKAAAKTEHYLQDHPKSAEALDYMGRARAIQGEHAAARQLFERALQIDPQRHSAQTNLARVLLREGKEGDAYALLKKFDEKDSKNVSALQLLAQLETARGNQEEAKRLYRRLDQIESENPRHLYMAGLMVLSLDRPDAAQQIAGELHQRFAGNPLSAQFKGLVLYRQQNFEDSVVELQRAIKSRPEVTAIYFLGLTYYHLGDYELALNQLQKVLDLKPSSVQARNMVAMTLLQQKRFEDAILEANMALRYDERNGLAYNIIGSALLARGEFDEAMEAFDRATELDPGLVDAHLKKGLFNLAQGNSQQGEEEMLQAITLAPEILDTRLVLASYHLRQQNYPAALEILEKGLLGREEDAVLYNVMAGALFARKKPEEALKALESAKEADPSYFTPYFNLASYYLSVGEEEKARIEFEAVLQKDPGEVRALVGSGQLSEMEGGDEEALGFYQRAAATGEEKGILALAFYHGKKEQPQKVLEVLEQGLKSQADSASLISLKGQILLRLGRLEEARAAYERLEELSPGQGYPTVVRILLRQEKKEEAEAIARGVIQKNPDKSYGYLLQAGILESAGQRDDGLQTLLNARSVVKNDPQLEMQIGALYESSDQREKAAGIYRTLQEKSPRYYPAIFALGSVYDTQGNKREALELYKKTLQIKGDYAPALNNLAFLYAENYGDLQEGLSLAMKAYRNTPGRPEIMDTLGYLLVRNNRAKEAIPLLEKAAGMLSHPTVLYHLALAYRDAEEHTLAARTLEKALEMGAFPEQKASRDLLAQLNS